MPLVAFGNFSEQHYKVLMAVDYYVNELGYTNNMSKTRENRGKALSHGNIAYTCLVAFDDMA